MISRRHIWPIFTLLLITAIGITLATDQETQGEPTGAMVTLETYDLETGEVVTGACFSLEHQRNGACDANSSGQMTFANPIPPGTYDVGYERTAHGSHLVVGNFPLIVTDEADLIVPVAFVQAEDGISEWVEVTVRTVSDGAATPPVAADACFVIHGASVNEIHGDVSFCGADSGPAAVRTGTYLLTSEACDVPNTGTWIAVMEDARIEVPLLETGCIAG